MSTFEKLHRDVYSVLQKRAARTCAISGFGMCSQRAGAEIGAGPDLYTACKVVNSHSDTACQFAKPVRVCPACKVADSYDSALHWTLSEHGPVARLIIAGCRTSRRMVSPASFTARSVLQKPANMTGKK